MVGCCGQSGSNQNTQNYNGGKSAPTNSGISSNKCVPDANTGRQKKGVPGRHIEEICHGTHERRRDLLDQVKIFLDEFDDKPCTVTPPQGGPDALRQLGNYPDYLKKHCQSWMPPNARPPLITSVQTHEIRASSDYEKMKGENTEYISFTDATLRPPVSTCDCVKRNGLQDHCPHPMCKPPTAQCKANNPGPCCPPSMGLGGPEAVLKSSKGAGGTGGSGTQCAQAQRPPPSSEYQDAFQYCPPGSNQQQMQAQPSGPIYTTTYRQDFQDQQGQQQQKCNQQNQQLNQQQQQQQQYQQQQHTIGFHQPGAGGPQPPPGMKMICICQAPSSALPSGKKYLCCPVPQ